MIRIRVMTDDFTSATDGVVGFAGLPGGAHVVLRDDEACAAGFSCGAVSIDTDSRHCRPVEAARRVARCAREWKHAEVLLKQFDSTLRGPLVAECVAAWQASGRRRLLVSPAFPAAGRTCEQGVVKVDGVPVHDTAFADDPLHPVRASSLKALFAEAEVDLPVAGSADEARSLFDQGHPALLVDALREDDLLGLARAFLGDRDLLWAGSTGLARALGLALGSLPRDRGEAGFDAIRASQRPGVLVGSRHPASRRQLAHLLARQTEVTPGCRLHIHATPDEPGDSGVLATEVARQAAGALRQGQCDGIVVSGGQTCKALADALGAHSMRLMHEIEPGVPLGLLEAPGLALPVVTKAGTFGRDDILVRCVQALRGKGS